MTRSLAVLHVDDEADIREVVALSLALDDGIEVTSAGSGDAALGLLEAGLRPDVILLDMMMPRLDGPGTLRRLRTIPGLQATPVIFMTARAQSAGLALGAQGVIVKPFDPMGLAREVRDQLAMVRP